MKFKIMLALSLFMIMFMCFYQAEADKKLIYPDKTGSHTTEENSSDKDSASEEYLSDTEDSDGIENEDTIEVEEVNEPDDDIQTNVREGGISLPTGDETESTYEAPTEETLVNDYIREENEYGDLLLKSYDFDGKKIAFFGDSITYGAIAKGGVTQNSYPKLFCEKVRAEYDNLAKGGSSFTGGGNEPASIVQTIKDTDLSSYDYLIIAGGANDLGNFHTSESMESALTDLCQYLKAHFTGADVIFITPPPNWYFEEEANEDSRLYPYRQAIVRIAKENDFSFINGDQMVIDDPDNKTIDIHPTEKGYELYAEELYKRLVK